MKTLIVMAKSPRAGHSKTRLTPPCTPEQAANLAEAALVDTLHTALACAADDVVVALDGAVGDWLPGGIDVIPQRGDGLAARLGAAVTDVGRPFFVIGMDTPQVTAANLDAALKHGCSLGRAPDGGWWGLGLPAGDGRVFEDVPMSASDTGDHQLARMRAVGYEPVLLDELLDVDTIADARAVAALAPSSRFAARMYGYALCPAKETA